MDVFHSTDNFIKFLMDIHCGSLNFPKVSVIYPFSQCSSLTELHLNKQIRPAAETQREGIGLTCRLIFNNVWYYLKGVILLYFLTFYFSPVCAC